MAALAAAAAPGGAEGAAGAMEAAADADVEKRTVLCRRLDRLEDLHAVIREQNHDFWLSCLAEGAHISFQKSLDKMICDGMPANEAFTHCYVARAKDIKAETNALIDEHGLGLRKKRVHANTGPGYILLLVSHGGFTGLSLRNSRLSSTDRRLSTQERLRRSKLRFVEADGKQLIKAAKKYRLSFWLTTYSGLTAQETRLRVVAAKMDQVYATDRFSMCFLYETDNLYRVCQKIVSHYGMGLRKHKIHSKELPGCVALLVSELEQNQAPTQKQVSRIAPGGTQVKKKKKKNKKDKKDKGDEQPEESAPASAVPGGELGAVGGLEATGLSAVDLDLEDPAAADASTVGWYERQRQKEERRHKQMQFLERRLATLFASLTPQQQQQMTAEQVQARLEASIGKPPGRLAEFRRDLGRLWVSLVEAEVHRRQLLVLERKLELILPLLPLERLSTEFVQAKLEESMQRPAGRFDKYRGDIEAFWRAFAEARGGVPAPSVSSSGDGDEEAKRRRLSQPVAPLLSVPTTPPLQEALVVDDISDSDGSDIEFIGLAGAGAGALGGAASSLAELAAAAEAAALAEEAGGAAGDDDGMEDEDDEGGESGSASEGEMPDEDSDNEGARQGPVSPVSPDAAPVSPPAAAAAASSSKKKERGLAAKERRGGDGDEGMDIDEEDEEMDEFGLSLALGQLDGGDGGGGREDVEVALRLLLRSRPSKEALEATSWRARLEGLSASPASSSAADGAAPASDAGGCGGEGALLARRVLARFSRLAGAGAAAAVAPPSDMPPPAAAPASRRAASAGAGRAGACEAPSAPAAPTSGAQAFLDSAFAALAKLQAQTLLGGGGAVGAVGAVRRGRAAARRQSSAAAVPGSPLVILDDEE